MKLIMSFTLQQGSAVANGVRSSFPLAKVTQLLLAGKFADVFSLGTSDGPTVVFMQVKATGTGAIKKFITAARALDGVTSVCWLDEKTWTVHRRIYG